MKKLILTITLLALATPALARDHFVNGYTRSNGTYVQPHYQTNPDRSMYNNYSTRGNVNPYTGQAGTVNPGYAPIGNSYPAPRRSFNQRLY
jgi:hypothetical protein